MINQYRITLVSFLAYFVMSGMLSPIGIIVGPMAEHFNLPITEITAKFSWLTLGILVGAGLALVVFDALKLKTIMLFVYALIASCLFGLLLTESLLLVGIAIGLVGVGCGIGLAGAASIISSTYDADSRASMLVITDGCFSVAGIVCSAVAVYLIGSGFHWSGSYGFIGLVAVVIVLLVGVSTLPEYRADEEEVNQEEGRTDEQAGVWPLEVWLCIGGLFLYTLGQYSLLWWLPNYAETQLGIAPAQAGEIVGRFWSGMFAAQIFVAWWVYKIGVNRLVVIGAFATAICSIPLWLVESADQLVILAFVWGFANLGLLKIVISFGTQMVDKPSPRLISAMLFGATSGTAASPWVTSQIVEFSNNHTILQFGTGCYVLLTLLILIAGQVSKRNSHAARA